MKVNIDTPFVVTETRTLPIKCKDTEQRFWYYMGLRPVNLLMYVKEIDKKKGVVIFECKIPHAISHYMMPNKEEL